MSIVVNKTRLPVTQWQTESGSVVSISDARKRYAKSLSVALEPIQDLHGYANPWVGGAGKNKCSMADQTFVQYLEVEIDEIPAGTYNYSAVVTSSDTDDTKCAIVFLDADKNTLSSKALYRSVGGSRISTEFTVSSPIKYLRLYASSGWPSGAGDTASFVDNMICLASATDPTVYAPYKNICPISGRTGINVTRDGKNLLELYLERTSDRGVEYSLTSDGKIHVEGTATSTSYSGVNYATYEQCPWKFKAGTYIFSGDFGQTSANNYYANLGIRKKSDNSTANYPAYSNGTKERVVTINEDFGAWFWVASPKDVYINEDVSLMLEYGDTATAWKQYQGTVYPVSWQTEVGTVYGCSVDLVSGVMRVTNGYLNLNTANMNNNEDYPGWRDSGVLEIIGSGLNIGLYNAFTNISPIITSGHWAVGANTRNNGSTLFLNTLYFHKSQTEWQALAMDIQFVIPLATPQIIQLSPNQIQMLERNNTVWSDAGQVTLEYAKIRS